jgi:uncharacterized protein YndB with AHSA1/START domain
MPLSLSLAETIAAPPGIVWAALTDIPGWAQWVPNLVRLDMLAEGQPGGVPFGVHTRWREVRRMFDRDASEEYEVTALEPQQLLVLHVDGRKGATGRGEYRFRYRLEPVAIGTRLHLDTDILGMGWLFRRVAGKLFQGGLRRTLASDLTAFKRHVESQPAR